MQCNIVTYNRERESNKELFPSFSTLVGVRNLWCRGPDCSSVKVDMCSDPSCTHIYRLLRHLLFNHLFPIVFFFLSLPSGVPQLKKKPVFLCSPKREDFFFLSLSLPLLCSSASIALAAHPCSSVLSTRPLFSSSPLYYSFQFFFFCI